MGDDLVRGGRGADVICGGKDSDVLHGGRGADDLDGGLDRTEVEPEATYFYGDTLDGGPRDDRLDPGRDRYRDDGDHLGTFDTLDFAAGAAVHVDLGRGRASGQGQDLLVTSQEMAVRGSAFDDVLRGTDDDEDLNGGPGDDRLLGRGGQDRLGEDADGATGDDLFVGGDGRDLLLTTNGRDTVLGGLDWDHLEIRSDQVRTVDAGWGADDVTVRAVVDGATVTGNRGGDEVAVVLGGTAPLSIDMATGAVVQGDRTMTLTGFERWLLEADAPTTVSGTEGRDLLTIVRASATMWMLGGDDSVVAGTGDDMLDGGAGQDYADLGSGTNSCTNVEAGVC